MIHNFLLSKLIFNFLRLDFNFRFEIVKFLNIAFVFLDFHIHLLIFRATFFDLRFII